MTRITYGYGYTLLRCGHDLNRKPDRRTLERSSIARSMKLNYYPLFLLLFTPLLANGQTFTLGTGILSNQGARSGGVVGIADMDGDGLDDLILVDRSRYLYIDYQEEDGTFTSYYMGQIASRDQWGIAVGDVRGDGHKDFFSGGSSGSPNFLQITGRGQAEPWTTLNGGSIFMQCANMVDVNNDGHVDIYANNDVGAPKIWLNDGLGNMSYNSNVIDFSSDPPTDMSGNYGAVWMDVDNDGDVDLFIAKCRQGVNNPNDPRRWNRLFVNDGNGNYTEMTVERGLENREQTWSADMGDINNDGHLDLVITNHSRSMQLYLNDGNGNFTEATVGSGLQISGAFLQVKLVDLDNDGYLDLITSGNLGGSAEHYFKGNGDGTFTEIPEMLPEPTPRNLHTFAIGDLNHDGFLDVYAGYGSAYVNPAPSYRTDELYLNDGNSNRFISFNLRGTQSNPDALGARVTIYGPWGTQIREVRSGESYGIVCSFACHFGLGQADVVDSAIVRWPSGIVDKYYGLDANQWITVNEGETRSAMVAAKVLLSGAYEQADELMHDGLREQGLIPTTEPYTALGRTAIGTSVDQRIVPGVLDVQGPDAIVDWVWLELRDPGNPAQAVAARAALLQRDGDIVDMDGKSPVNLGVPSGQYHLVVSHRNHLGVMADQAHELGSTPTVIDLSSAATTTWGVNALKVQGVKALLWAGDVNGDGKVMYTGVNNDRDRILIEIGGVQATNTVQGYHTTDVNLDGTVKYTGPQNDRDRILMNQDMPDPNTLIQEQLP